NVVHVLGGGKRGHVIDHDAAGALQGHEGIGAAVHRTNRDALRLRSLLARAVIHHGVVVGAVVVIGQVPGGEGLKVVAAGEHLGDAVLPGLINGKGAAAEEVVLAAVQAVKVLHLEEDHLALQAGVLPGDGSSGGGHALLAEVLLVLAEVEGAQILVAPLSGVALVGGDQIGFAVHLEGGDAVGHPDAHEAAVGPGRIGVILLVDINGGDAVVLKTCGVDPVKGTGGQIQHGDGIVLLQGDIGLAAGYGDILRL